MDNVLFTWQARLSCLDVGDLIQVAQLMEWTCIANLEGTTTFTSGFTKLSNANAEEFIPVELITASVIRSWVDEADLIEDTLRDRVTIMHYLPEPTQILVPVEE